jgi:hypothetical protein
MRRCSLREGILKENIVGEALIWAHDRLRARSERPRACPPLGIGRVLALHRLGTRLASRTLRSRTPPENTVCKSAPKRDPARICNKPLIYHRYFL